jgi:hypothetical protein
MEGPNGLTRGNVPLTTALFQVSSQMAIGGDASFVTYGLCTSKVRHELRSVRGLDHR